MFQCEFNTLCLVINLMDEEWLPWHVMVDIFEVANTSWMAFAKVVKRLLSKFGLTNRVLTYVKDEIINLSTLAIAPKFVMKCKLLKIDEPYFFTCFEHVMSKVF